VADVAGLALVFLAGALAAAINAFAGGGSLISFPALVWLGLDDKIANATNGVSLFPGSFSSALGFRSHWKDARRDMVLYSGFAIVGSVAGAWLLVLGSNAVFRLVVPFLILFASLLMANQKRIRRWGGSRQAPRWAGPLGQMAVSVYGGYFGAGQGILMLALYGHTMEGDIHRHNAVKSMVAFWVNLASSVVLASQGLVDWRLGAAMAAGALVGGFSSAKLSQKVNPDRLRWAVVAYGFIMGGWFLYRAFQG
jgi:uncharacterized membrane protein YfcA